MSKNAMMSKVENDRVLVLERVFDAPRSQVYKMFKEPDYLKQWWGPRGWELPICNMEFKPGGFYHYCMKCMDQNQDEFYGMESWGKAFYKEIVEPEKIVYVDYFSDEDGNTNDIMPATRVTADFVEMDGKTKLVNRCEYASAEELKTILDMGAIQGITETWDRLEELLKKQK
ncbi:ATPase [Fictibacillus phosphorivorans]|uniref:ATPase n=1 Tax=Fictibacillus phosphorivorans TaxID=1221500 RepID=A0A161TS09_9BACL|nr:SRPBCC domain-containing protein [Fictibacillus phosphorivorans]KZE69201.1 ATPase [Fictibacillus phosphorivorans]